MKLITLIGKYVTIALIFLIPITTNAQTLAAGDIAIVGINTDGPNASTDEIAIVTLASIPTGTTIYFSDYYWDNTNSRWGNDGLNGTTANTTEGTIKWTTTSAIAAGTVFKISWVMGSGTPSVSGLPGTLSVVTGQTGVTPFGPLGNNGDNIFIYQSNNNGVTPSNWIFGWCNGLATTVSANNAWQSSNTPISGVHSMLPTGLTNGTSAISFAQIGSGTASNPSFDNNVYNIGSLRSGTKAAVLSAICTTSSWIGDETTAYDIAPTSTYFTGANAFFISTLPLSWLNISGNFNSQKQTTITWQVQENNVANYQIEKSTNGRTFAAIGNISSKGNGENIYSHTDVQNPPLEGREVFYRVKQIDVDGRFSYSTIIKLSGNQNGTITVYPNPVKDVFTLSVNKTLLNTKAIIVTATGVIVQQIKIAQLQTQINIDALPSGIYMLKTIDGATQKIIKQ